jgi:hypothetical protein
VLLRFRNDALRPNRCEHRLPLFARVATTLTVCHRDLGSASVASGSSGVSPPIAELSIDQNVLGMHLAENLRRDFPQVVPETFTNESKEVWANDFEILLQRKDIVLPKDREWVAQIHSVNGGSRRAASRASRSNATTPAAATPTASGPSRSRAGRNEGRCRARCRRSA